MRPIQKRKKNISVRLKVFIVSFICIALVSFIFKLKLSEKSQKVHSDLHFSSDLMSPQCSAPGGFYRNIFEVKLSSPDSSNTIYYTTDGSEPSLNSTIYFGPITIRDRSDDPNYLSNIPTSPRWKPPIDNVFKGTLLRSIIVDKENNKSAELVRSFFVLKKGSSGYSLPVISFCINEKDFFGYNKGIYVLGKSYSDKDNYIRKEIPLNLPWWEYPSNYLMRGNDAERVAHMEFYEPENKLGFEGNVGVRINGNATRGFAQKSLRICFREKYGQAALNYALFSSNPVRKFNSFILRNSGNDWDKTMFRDGFMQSLMKNTKLDIQDYRPSIVFINGEYWGIHNIRERFDENYLANKYHLNTDSLTILELSGQIVYGKKGDEKMFQELLGFVKSNDLSKEQNYNYVRSKIDLESFSDFVIANVYFCNSDWPNNNVKFWRFNSTLQNDSISPKDGRWRWMLYDTDWGFGYNSDGGYNVNLLSKASNIGSVGQLFSALIRNHKFVIYFTQRFQTHLNSIFNASEVVKKIDQIERDLAPEMQEHIDRWRAIDSYSSWQRNVNVLRDFAKNRPQIQADQLNSFFKLTGDEKVIIKK